jgi:hypothetical protein
MESTWGKDPPCADFGFAAQTVEVNATSNKNSKGRKIRKLGFTRLMENGVSATLHNPWHPSQAADGQGRPVACVAGAAVVLL